MGSVWTEKEDQYIRDNSNMPDDVLARAIHRSEISVYNRRRHLGVPPMSGWDGIRKPIAMSPYEKVYRIKKMAMDMRVKLKGDTK